jgi:pimeloyl-ACP methyl ester carboxylesterase
MPTPAVRTTTEASLAFHDVLSDDGTVLRVWTNDPDGLVDGPTVVLCNGLGTSAHAWPALLRPDCGVRVVSWNHRGTGGSDRPADPSHIEVEHFVQDGLSVMDHFGIDRAVLMGWSMGVNTMFELAVRHPERVRGLFAVAGVPGDTFATMLGPLRLPHPVARLLTVNLTRALRLGGFALTPVASRLPIGPRTIAALSRTGFMFRVPDPELAATAVREFFTTPIGWYMQMALSTSRHARVSLGQVDVPCAFVAGRYDVLAGARDMASAAERLRDATYDEIRGSHFIQMEQPEQVHRLLLDFLAKVG